MAGKLTQAGIQRAADALGCEVAAIRAVITVETAGSGFLADGRPKILFERHIFSRRTGGKFDQSHPDLSNPRRGGYVGNEGEYPRLYRALQLDHDAAIESASWGLGQVMGFNWALCGEKSLIGFLMAMHHNEDSQLALMAAYIQRVGLADELQRRDWDGFRLIYNGPASDPIYGKRLATAYAAARK